MSNYIDMAAALEVNTQILRQFLEEAPGSTLSFSYENIKYMLREIETGRVLRNVLREYLERPGVDGSPVRHDLREQLQRLIDEC